MRPIEDIIPFKLFIKLSEENLALLPIELIKDKIFLPLLLDLCGRKDRVTACDDLLLVERKIKKMYRNKDDIIKPIIIIRLLLSNREKQFITA